MPSYHHLHTCRQLFAVRRPLDVHGPPPRHVLRAPLPTEFWRLQRTAFNELAAGILLTKQAGACLVPKLAEFAANFACSEFARGEFPAANLREIYCRELECERSASDSTPGKRAGRTGLLFRDPDRRQVIGV